jgi:hypothetical protein
MARGSKDDLPDGESEIFEARGLDSRLSVDPSREMRFLAQPDLRVRRLATQYAAPTSTNSTANGEMLTPPLSSAAPALTAARE